MRRYFWASALATLAVTATIHAQWLDHKTPGTPRLPDGRPNLSAPDAAGRERQAGSVGHLGSASATG